MTNNNPQAVILSAAFGAKNLVFAGVIRTVHTWRGPFRPAFSCPY
jgi:hypothetical protein